MANTTMTEARINELREIFNLVADSENWKNPIDATVYTGVKAEDVREAVIFFAGCVPTITTTTVLAYPHPSALVRVEVPALHVTAVGYYEAVGA